jgi:hypothetical protein
MAWLLGCGCAAADDAAPAGVFKLTLGDYRYNDFAGHDANLRYRRDSTDAWLGAYHDRGFGTQTRAGLDSSLAPVDWIALQPSLQLASGGFVGGSFNLQLGDAWYGVLGIGRTNLKPYANLNFDPNDALTFAAGHQTAAGATYSITLIADDRLHTGQRDLHFFGQWPVGRVGPIASIAWLADTRLSVDLMRKRGRGDDGLVRAWAYTLTADFSAWFVRLARDPKQNFSAQDALRLSAGIRF